MLPFLIILVAYAVLTTVEVRWSGPASRSRRADLLMVLPVMLAAAGTDLALVGVVTWAENRSLGLIPTVELPIAAAVCVTILTMDLSAYAGHRLRHRLPLLWSFHRAHHTDTDMDVTTLLRQHPVDVVVLGAMSTLTAVLLGAPPVALAVWAALAATFGAATHARVRLPGRLEQALATVLQTPGTHRVHHAPVRPLTDSNFGLVLTVWDRLFGSLSAADPTQVTGLDTADLAERQGARDLLAEPWRPTIGIPQAPEIRTGRPGTRGNGLDRPALSSPTEGAGAPGAQRVRPA